MDAQQDLASGGGPGGVPGAVLLFTIDWRNRACTQRLIDSMAGVDAVLHIIVNDDQPADYRVPDGGTLTLQTHRMGRNLGFSGACNEAMRLAEQASCEFLLHLNNDVELDQDADLAALYRLAGEQDRVAVLSPTVRNRDGRLEFAGSSFWARLTPALMISRSRVPGDGEAVIDSVFFDGACFLARTRALRQCGGFDPDYFAYREEHDLAARLRAAGWVIAYTPCMTVFHASSSSSGRYPRFKQFLITRGQILYLRKNLRGAAALLFALILAVKSVSRVILGLIRADLDPLRAVSDAIASGVFRRPIRVRVGGETLVL
jgi:GT2 family glycosyltransferase